ncbi:hypothetical protein IC232_03450 [Microvirga sp. BT688]|uniref:hypothetical protein n=1 Tax=Microvirga sp. TaxID=1873136 RepID=UPI001685B73A|nr:hypothetical protein [Microvirga sp.]MBD2745745.1 hypothetical protein [Microvirga sp.]
MTLKEALRVELKALAPTVAFIWLAYAMIMWVYENGPFGVLGVVLVLGAIRMAIVFGWTVVKIGAFVAAFLAIVYVLTMVF